MNKKINFFAFVPYIGYILLVFYLFYKYFKNEIKLKYLTFFAFLTGLISILTVSLIVIPINMVDIQSPFFVFILFFIVGGYLFNLFPYLLVNKWNDILFKGADGTFIRLDDPRRITFEKYMKKGILIFILFIILFIFIDIIFGLLLL